MEATQIHLDYLNREEPANDSHPHLKIEDKCYKVGLHQHKMKGYNNGLPNWNEEKENQLLQFVSDNGLDTKVCLLMKRFCVEGLTLVESYEKYLDTLRKPHPRYDPSVKGMSDSAAEQKWLKSIASVSKNVPKLKRCKFLDDPNPDQIFDLRVEYH
jgi:hypothetical protein